MLMLTHSLECQATTTTIILECFMFKVIGRCSPYRSLIPYISYNRSKSLMNNEIADLMHWLSSPLDIFIVALVLGLLTYS